MANEPLPPSNRPPNGQRPLGRMEQGLPSWTLWLILIVVVGALLASMKLDPSPDTSIGYSQFLSSVRKGEVKTVEWDNTNASIIIGFFVWMQRRAQGQMGNIMSIGRSRAKTYSTERPAPPSPTSPATRA
jgi:ATP-dependent Zn protease